MINLCVTRCLLIVWSYSDDTITKLIYVSGANIYNLAINVAPPKLLMYLEQNIILGDQHLVRDIDHYSKPDVKMKYEDIGCWCI